jgi:hypothetical protein
MVNLVVNPGKKEEEGSTGTSTSLACSLADPSAPPAILYNLREKSGPKMKN